MLKKGRIAQAIGDSIAAFKLSRCDESSNAETLLNVIETCLAMASIIRVWSSLKARTCAEYTVRTPISSASRISGVLRQLLSLGDCAAAASPRSRVASEFEMVCRLAATHPLNR